MKLLMESWRDWIGLGKEEPEPEAALESEEEGEDEEQSQEAKLAMLALHEDEGNRDQALMMFEMLADGLDLDLLATELDDRLYDLWKIYQRENQDAEKQSSQKRDVFAELLDWLTPLQHAETFISGGGLNRELKLSQDLYKLGSAQDMIADELRKTASLWRER